MEGNNEVVYLYLDDIIPNRFQPREVFDDQALKELAVSIKEHGVIQPIIVRKVENKYEIIAGERRYKASTMAGLTKIPAIVKNLDDKESSKVALIENLQRRDLTPIEEARTYQKILELEDGMTQEQLAQTMGKTQSVVSNKLRLLALPDEIQDALLKEKISERHARSLLNVQNKNDQIKLLDKIIAEKMTVRELDKEIKDMNDNQGQNAGGMPNLFNTMGNAMNTNSFGQNLTGVGFNSQTVADSSQAVSLVNPTTVDIDKIRENAVDIAGPKTPALDVKELMKDVSSPTQSEFKFVENSFKPLTESPSNQSFSFPSTQAPQQSANSSPSSGFGGFFGVDPQKNITPTNNIASSIPGNPFNLTSLNTAKKDVTVAINDIKDTVKNIETKGYNVSVEETDSGDSYQIIIKVNKNV